MTHTDFCDPCVSIVKMPLCNKGLKQGWGQLVPPLVDTVEGNKGRGKKK